MKRTLKEYVVLLLKGMSMGAADVVPGVSGGTIAFISGIYEELLSSISSFNFRLIKALKTDGIKSVWIKVNGSFLTALFAGIFVSFISLSRIIETLLRNQPVLIWSFFFGLVLASIVYIGKQINKWTITTITLLVLSGSVAFYITRLTPSISENASYLFLFLAGMVAVCAMMLPGISGSFILVILGAYKPILNALNTKDFSSLFIFSFGGIVGLLTFSRILKWFFAIYKDHTLAVLTGFIIGSLNKIWPWKETISWRINSKGFHVPFSQTSIFPSSFNGDPQIELATLLFLVGFVLVLLLEKLASKKSNE